MAAHWGNVLEALHSATIDALNIKFPEIQLLLGLPKKTTDATPPDPSCTTLFQIGIEVPGLGQGIVILAAAPGLKLPLKELWDLTLTQAQAGSFPQRDLSPVFASASKATLRQVIWYPVGVSQDRILLGLGIR